MTITLTREEAQQVLDALVFATPSGFGPAEVYKDSVVLLQNRLEQPDSKAHLQFSGPMHVVCKCDKCKAQPEPVAWRFDQAKYRENDLRGRQWTFNVFSQSKPYMDEMVRNVTPLYTAPPQREWQGLTDEEIMEMLDYGQYGNVPQYARNFVDAIEAKLKEKNT